MKMTNLRGSRWHLFLNDTEPVVLDQVPTITLTAPRVVLSIANTHGTYEAHGFPTPDKAFALASQIRFGLVLLATATRPPMESPCTSAHRTSPFS
jgi:hypothetical protein